MIISIFYSKTTGLIYTSTMAQNEYDYGRFGKFADEMSQVLDILYVKGDRMLYDNIKQYKVDLDTKQLVLIEDIKIDYL